MIEQSEQIGVLSVDISWVRGNRTANLERGLELEEDGLLHEYLSALHAEAFDLAFKEVHLPGNFGVAHRQKLVDNVVNIYFDFAVHPNELL